MRHRCLYGFKLFIEYHTYMIHVHNIIIYNIKSKIFKNNRNIIYFGVFGV